MKLLNYTHAETVAELQNMDLDFDAIRAAASASVRTDRGPCVPTNSGNTIDLDNLSAGVFDIRDIAHSLSNICRFTGATMNFFSVAQHSLMVCDIVPEEHKLAALLHDAVEAFLGDFSAPMKRKFPAFKQLEHEVEAELLSRFGISLPLHPWIKYADLIALATEQRDLMPYCSLEWAIRGGIPILADRIIPMPPEMARAHFLARFTQLTTQAGRSASAPKVRLQNAA